MIIRTWMQADAALRNYAKQATELAEQQAALETELARVRATFERHTELTTAELAETEAALKKFAQGHKNEFKPSPAGDGRSYEHAGAVLGFRQTPGRVEIRNEEKTIEWLRDCRNGRFVRLVHQPNREALLEALRDGSDQRLIETLAAHGIRFKQKDKFFLEVAKEG